MRVIINWTDWGNDSKATRFSPKEHLKKEIFEAVERSLHDADMDRDVFGDRFDTPDGTHLVGVTLEDDGTVWVRVTFVNTADLRLSELQLPQEAQDRVVAQMVQLVPPKRNSGRNSTTAVASE